MYEDERKNEIEHVLKRGKEILNEHPEMYEKTYQEVLNILDDGTREMIHNRWGVTARMLAENMNVTNLTDLVDGLAKEVEFCGRKTLTCEYAGYLLQQEYGVDLIELLFLAGEKGVIDRIISFVRPNIYYAKTFRREQVTKLIGLLERHKGEEWGDGILWAYRCFVMKMETYAVVFDEIGEVRCQTEYRLLGLFRGSWYQKNRDEAETVSEKLLALGGKWNAMTAIDFLETGLNYGETIFRKNFQRLCELAHASSEIEEYEIPLLVQYETRYGEKEKTIDEEILKRLNEIPSGVMSEKLRFAGIIADLVEVPDNIEQVFKTMIFSDFHKDSSMLTTLDMYYARVQKNGNDIVTVLENLRHIFIANGYRGNDYMTFFRQMPMVHSILRKDEEKVTAAAISYIVGGGMKELFFGIGLLSEAGSFAKITENCEAERGKEIYSEKDWIRVVRAILYYTYQGELACSTAFHLLKAEMAGDEYIEVCMYEIYGNYPDTMRKTAENYRKSEYKQQVKLAERVLEHSEKARAIRERIYEIKDLRPSEKDQMMIRYAECEFNRKVNKNADKASLTGLLFQSRTLKYGARSGTVITGRKQELMYQANPFMKFEHSVELPNLYIEDPVGYELMRQRFEREVESDASGN